MGKRDWELVGTTDQEVEAELDLLEAVNVLCLCDPCWRGAKWWGRLVPGHPETLLLLCPSELTPLSLVLFFPKPSLLLMAGLCLDILQLSCEQLDVP